MRRRGNACTSVHETSRGAVSSEHFGEWMLTNKSRNKRHSPKSTSMPNKKTETNIPSSKEGKRRKKFYNQHGTIPVQPPRRLEAVGLQELASYSTEPSSVKMGLFQDSHFPDCIRYSKLSILLSQLDIRSQISDQNAERRIHCHCRHSCDNEANHATNGKSDISRM